MNKKEISKKAAEAKYANSSARLSRTLFGPAAALSENKRLAVIFDETSNCIPFLALLSPKNEGSTNMPLALNHVKVGRNQPPKLTNSGNSGETYPLNKKIENTVEERRLRAGCR